MTVLERPDAEEALAARIREATERLSTEFHRVTSPRRSSNSAPLNRWSSTGLHLC